VSDLETRQLERAGDETGALVAKIRAWDPPPAEIADDLDWMETFSLLGEPDAVPPGSEVDCSAFSLDDVEHVYAAFGESAEGYGEWSGHAVFRLKDGRYGTAYGWCDTTGWG